MESGEKNAVFVRSFGWTSLGFYVSLHKVDAGKVMSKICLYVCAAVLFR